MARVLKTLEEVVGYFSEEIAELKANQLANEAVVLVVFGRAADTSADNGGDLRKKAQAQMNAVVFSSGDPDLNEAVRARAIARLAHLFDALDASARERPRNGGRPQ